VLLLSALLLGIGLAACGQSDEEKAKSDVCDARADIQKNVKELQGLTLGTATVDKVRSNVAAIKSDLSKIADAQGKLSDSQRKQIEQANETFKSKVQALAGDVGKSVSIQDAVTKLKSDFADLAATYEQSFARFDCG
jgi:uncharacterized protein YjbJ (UPF0337 family)